MTRLRNAGTGVDGSDLNNGMQNLGVAGLEGQQLRVACRSFAQVCCRREGARSESR